MRLAGKIAIITGAGSGIRLTGTPRAGETRNAVAAAAALKVAREAGYRDGLKAGEEAGYARGLDEGRRQGIQAAMRVTDEALAELLDEGDQLVAHSPASVLTLTVDARRG